MTEPTVVPDTPETPGDPGTIGLEAPEAEDDSLAGAGTTVAVGTGAVVTAAAGGSLDRQASLWSDAWRQLRRKPVFIFAAVLILLFSVMAAFPSLFTNADPRDCDLSRGSDRPSEEHLFGFDRQGCDYYARVIYGARVSMVVGVATVALSGFLGVVLGSLAGYYGGWLDTIISRITDIALGVPLILFAIVVLSVLGDRGLFEVTMVLVVLGWPTTLRLMRSAVLSAKEVEYVQAARALGASDRRILVRHILPNAIAPVIVYETISVGIVIAAEATLSFLGVGLQLPAISWGLMISDSQRLIRENPHLLFFPAGFLSLTVLAFILLGDALRDALDPKLR